MKRLLTISFYSFARQLNKHKMPNIRELKKQMQKQNMSIINNNSANNPGDLPQNSFLKKEETKEVKT